MATDVADAALGLSALSENERDLRFENLQQRMTSVWDSIQLDHADESVVVVPSVSLPRVNPSAGSGSLSQAMEERLLFLLLLLRQPRLRMIYVTSLPISRSIVEYYLALLPGIIPSHALSRLTFISVNDSSPRPLSQKLLDRPRLLRSIAAAIPNIERCHLIPYNTTALERDVAVTIGIPMYGADPRLAPLGTKSGCRRLFAEEGVPHPLGAENLHSIDEVVQSIASMLDVRPVREVIVKLNDGVSGNGNALVNLTGAAELSGAERIAAISASVDSMQLEAAASIPRDAYLRKFAADGGIVEERISGTELLSPSVQLRVLPGGRVELLSTHDQLLGGASGQSYLGCCFPADPAYSRLITEPALRIGERLSKEGVLGRFAIDFVVVRNERGEWSAYAIEINLRKGGTTHPFLTLQYLTDGMYDGNSGKFLTADGAEKHLVATDHLESDDLRALSVDDLFDIVARHRLHYDQSRQTGIVFHMISCITEHGRVGMTAVGDTAEDAMRLYERGQQILLSEAREARAEHPLPG